jgi:dimethylaniline monooxygenase (N-oxide forming)
VPATLQRGPLLWWYYNLWIKTVLPLIGGTQGGPDQWVGQMSRERWHVNSRA